MKKVKAIWIIDNGYIVPAYLSICSFLKGIDTSVTLVYCGDEDTEEVRSIFTGLSENIMFETFTTPEEFKNHKNQRIIVNRLARMHYVEKYCDDITLLIDADTLFSDQCDTIVATLQAECQNKSTAVFGVLDAKIAYRDYLYFNTADDNGRDIVIPLLEQKDIYIDVFGPNWWHHLKGASINNGLVAFYNCPDLIEVWRDYYQRGLNHKYVNPSDDQLPLAAAIHKTGQEVVRLPERFNSKGQVSGDFITYHALSSIWKMQIYSAYHKANAVSDFANLASQFLPVLPEDLLEGFMNEFDHRKPHLFRELKGKFGYQHLYEDVHSGFSSGVFVEVGAAYGKSACFMSELIKIADKNIRFYSIDLPKSKSEKLEEFISLLEKFELDQYCTIVDYNKRDIVSDLHGEADFVFLNLGNDYDLLLENLEYWYDLLGEGGILAGYDYTSQIGLNYGNKCATYDFCKRKNLSLRISFNIFIIEKPKGSTFIEKRDQELLLQSSNVGS